MKSMPGLFPKLLVVSMLGVALFAVGCKREAPEPPVDPAIDNTAAVDAIAVIEQSPADSITATSMGFDSKSFAGKFGGTDATVELNADGNFVLVETSQGAADGPNSIDGTWTVESDGKQLRLDPSSKEEADRVFAIVSNDEIRLLAEDGSSAGSGPAYSLKRDGSAQ